MKEKILLITLMAVLMVGLAEATLTLNISGTQTESFNIGAGSTTMNNITSCTWYVYGTDTGLANTSTTNTFGYTSDPVTSLANQTRFSLSNAANNLQDSTYTFKATCSNYTGTPSESATASILINVGSPICAVNIPFASKTTQNPDATWTATSGNATQATLYFGAGNPKAMTFGTLTDRQQTWSFKGNIPETVYDHVYVIFSDGNDQTTCTSSDYVNIDDKQRTGSLAISTDALNTQQQQAVGVSPKIPITLIIIVGALILILGNNKKKK